MISCGKVVIVGRQRLRLEVGPDGGAADRGTKLLPCFVFYTPEGGSRFRNFLQRVREEGNRIQLSYVW